VLAGLEHADEGALRVDEVLDRVENGLDAGLANAAGLALEEELVAVAVAYAQLDAGQGVAPGDRRALRP
jgi:hypothetical protein